MKLKLKEGILIQEVAGEKILMASGMEEVDYSRMIVLNPSAALLAEALIERSCTLQQLVETDVYDADEVSVAKDVEEWLEQLWELRVLEKTDC
mgnify:CR=1 FL=1